MHILLLNPPAKNIILRDYYCSKVSKASYVLHPVDLCMLSGTLASRHAVSVIDAIAERLSEDACLSRIADLNIDAVIFLAGQVSYKNDLLFIRKVKEQTRAKTIGTGDIFMEDGDRTLKENPFLDAIILDFTTDDILKFLDGKKADNMVYAGCGTSSREIWKEFSIPVPRHELFKNRLYTSPFMKHHTLVTVLTDYGCPYKCDFCIMGALGYKFRGVENVMDELLHIRSMGIRELYFDDQTFGANKERTLALLAKMRGMGFSWSCLSRADIMSDDLARAMKDSGCHTAIMGVESGSQKLLDRHHKNTTITGIKKGFHICHKHGINTVRTFMFGLPGETENDILDTIDFAVALGCDYASFNTAVPRMNTRLLKDAVSGRLITGELCEMDQSGNCGVLGMGDLSAEKIRYFRKKAICRFYFRPSYLLKRLKKITTLYELRSNIINGLAIWGKR